MRSFPFDSGAAPDRSPLQSQRTAEADRKASGPAALPARDDGAGRRLEVRSITGARYTLVEDARAEHGPHRFRTAFAGLPVVANDDGSFTIVATHTRLVRVAAST